jgi:uncharacterized protein YjbI with pentapeptide repeats
MPSLEEKNHMKTNTLNLAPTAPLAIRLGYTLVCLFLYFSGLGNRWGTIRLPRVFYPDVEKTLALYLFCKEGEFKASLYEEEGWFGGRGIVGRFSFQKKLAPQGVIFRCKDLWDFNPGDFELQKWTGLMVFVHLLEKWTSLTGLVQEDWGDSIVLDESLLGSLNSTHEFSHEWELEIPSQEVEKLKNQLLNLLRNRDTFFRELVIKELWKGADLSGADLSGVDLSGANLSEADLSGANLREADLSGANLSEANLREAGLHRANLASANLARADLSGADLGGATLSEGYLSGADLSGADLSGVDLSWADISEANLSWADLSEANLSWADLSEANLSEANLSGANLNGANLTGANLSGADLSGADLRGANLRKANLRKANLKDALLP